MEMFNNNKVNGSKGEVVGPNHSFNKYKTNGTNEENVSPIMKQNSPAAYENMGELFYKEEAYGNVDSKHHLSFDVHCNKVKNSKKIRKK